MADGYEVGMKTFRNFMPMLRGVPDFSNATQFNQYESGYQFVLVCKIPKFIKEASTNHLSDGSSVGDLTKVFVSTIEQEGKGMSGFEDLTAETMEVTDGITTMEMISKVTMQGGSKFTMEFTEKAGTPIVKFCEYYLKGLKDPRTQAKTYNGLLDSGAITQPGFEKEVFTFMYINTDNTMKRIEKAYLLVNAQLTKAETTIYEATKGDIGNKQISLEINAFPITGKQVDQLAQKMLKTLYTRTDSGKVCLISDDYDYYMTSSDNNISNKGYSENVYTSNSHKITEAFTDIEDANGYDYMPKG